MRIYLGATARVGLYAASPRTQKGAVGFPLQSLARLLAGLIFKNIGWVVFGWLLHSFLFAYSIFQIHSFV